MHKSLGLVVFILLVGAAQPEVRAQTAYKLPPPEVVALVDAPAPPIARLDPQGMRLLLVAYEPNPGIAMLAKPFLRLAGLRIDPALQGRQRLRQYTAITIVDVATGHDVRVELPAGANFGLPVWSPDGSKLAIPVDTPAGVELWLADAASGKARRLGRVYLNDILGTPVEWDAGSTALLATVVPDGRGPAPAAPEVPTGPVMQETAGKHSKMFTYQDLLQDAHDEALFAHLATSQLVRVDAAKGKVTPLGAPGLILSYGSSPDAKFLLVTRLDRPFSYRVPYFYFTRSVEVWDARGKPLRTLAALPVSDEVPVQGVPLGPRSVAWQPLHDARLRWVEALDGGDPQQKVPHRERLMALGAPFTAEPEEILRLEQRFAGIDFAASRDEVWITEFDRDRRWRTTRAVNLGDPGAAKVLFDLSARDVYNDPGDPDHVVLPNGSEVMRQVGNDVFLRGNGATPQGRRPFLDRFDLKTLTKARVFHSEPDVVESFVGFVAGAQTAMVTQRESQTEPPNIYVVGDGSRRALTRFADPYPQMQGVQKQLLKYQRADGVPLSGTLYLPAGTRGGERLPCLVWAYPLEYSDAATAGQVRVSPQSFTFYRGASPLAFITQGYAVLMDATMPIVGDPETMNETFVEQTVAAAQAAIHSLDSLGVVDPARVLVAGHSYGAFMTANLLAHSDLFAGGIARSGAYNRTLTPFGFQSERRSFWEARDAYLKVSPFAFADKIDEPLLLIHGQADNNAGTYTLQSERMYEALQANGATARLVLLPHESHGYLARESILHTLAEMLEWGEGTVKPAGTVQRAGH